jgi:serine/threonine protein kinase
MAGRDSDVVIAIRQMIAENCVLKVNSASGQSREFRVERELGNGHFGVTYVAIELPSKDYVAIKLELEGSGRASADIFNQIQNRVGISPYFPGFRFYGDLASIRTTANGLNSQPSVRVPSGRSSIQISTWELDQLSQGLPVQFRGLPAELRVQFLVQIGAISSQKIQTEYRQAKLSCTIMDFVRGIPLHEKKFSLNMSTFYIWQAAKGLNALHEKGIVHGDIKPENIMVDVGGQVKLLDFTTSRILDRPIDPNTPKATSEYSPLTHFQQDKWPDTYSDVYGLGAVLYQLAVGEPPSKFSGNRFEYYSKIHSINDPWKSLLLQVFKENLSEIKKPSGKVQINLHLGSVVDVERIGEPIVTAIQLRDAIGKIVLQKESERRDEWDKMRQMAQRQHLAERDTRWHHLIQTVGTLNRWEELFQHEVSIQDNTEKTFRLEWEEEHKQRNAIEVELRHSVTQTEWYRWENAENTRRKSWQEEFLAWQTVATKELELKRIESWDKLHAHEWDSEVEHQFSWQQRRLMQPDIEKKHFQEAKQKQNACRLESDRQELWKNEVGAFRNRISDFQSEAQTEFSRRKRVLNAMIKARIQEFEQRQQTLKESTQLQQLSDWDQGWKQREQKSLSLLEPNLKNDERIRNQLQEIVNDLEQQEIQRRANRTIRDKLQDRLTIFEVYASKWISSSTHALSEILPTVLVWIVILACVIGGGFLFWQNMNAPNIDLANQDADLGISFHGMGEEFEKANDLQQAKAMYQQAMDKYLAAQVVYRKYFEHYPNDTSEDSLTAHYNLSVIDWNAYLLLSKGQVPNGTLEHEINLLHEADQHLSLYNAARPSEENQKQLLQYNIEILLLTYEQEDPQNAIQSLEGILNRMQQLNISFGTNEEAQLTLLAIADYVCSQKLDDLQQIHCETIIDQILSR